VGALLEGELLMHRFCILQYRNLQKIITYLKKKNKKKQGTSTRYLLILEDFIRKYKVGNYELKKLSLID
jgi:hypothetical protein